MSNPYTLSQDSKQLLRQQAGKFEADQQLTLAVATSICRLKSFARWISYYKPESGASTVPEIKDKIFAAIRHETSDAQDYGGFKLVTDPNMWPSEDAFTRAKKAVVDVAPQLAECECSDTLGPRTMQETIAKYEDDILDNGDFYKHFAALKRAEVNVITSFGTDAFEERRKAYATEIAGSVADFPYPEGQIHPWGTGWEEDAWSKDTFERQIEDWKKEGWIEHGPQGPVFTATRENIVARMIAQDGRLEQYKYYMLNEKNVRGDEEDVSDDEEVESGGEGPLPGWGGFDADKLNVKLQPLERADWTSDEELSDGA